MSRTKTSASQNSASALRRDLEQRIANMGRKPVEAVPSVTQTNAATALVDAMREKLAGLGVTPEGDTPKEAA